MALAIFDLDNTLIAGDSDHAWGQYLVEQGIVDANLYQRANDQFLRDYQHGKLDILEYLAFALKPLSENNIEDLQAWRARFFASKIEPLILPKAKELVERHREKGDDLLIITATNRFVTEPIAQAFNITTLIATEPEIVNGIFTGKVLGTPSFQDGKITRLNDWLKDTDLSLDDAYFYSDSHNDLPLLKLVDNPVAVDPDETLRTHCEQNNWQILSLRDDQH